MKTKALQLSCRFSLPPNSLGYCGWDSAPEKFKTCIINGDCTGVEEEFSKFIVLNPYLKTLSGITGLDKFSYEVIEGYWLGNDHLKKAKSKHYETLMKFFLEQGVPDWFVDELRTKQPRKFIPHHLFQVLHVGVGKASGSVPFNIETINNCMIRWGKIEKINEIEMTVNLNSLEKEKDIYKITKSKEQFSYNPDILIEPEIGKIAVVHWKQPIKILTKDEEEKLAFWTNEVLKAIN